MYAGTAVYVTRIAAERRECRAYCFTRSAVDTVGHGPWETRRTRFFGREPRENLRAFVLGIICPPAWAPGKRFYLVGPTALYPKPSDQHHNFASDLQVWLRIIASPCSPFFLSVLITRVGQLQVAHLLYRRISKTVPNISG